VLLDPFMKACRSGNPEISDFITAGSTSMSRAKVLPERVPSKWPSFMRSISTLPSLAHPLAGIRLLRVLRKILVVGMDRMTSARWP